MTTAVALPGLAVKKGVRGWPQTEAQLVFVRGYAIDLLSPPEAALRAGYTKHYAKKKAHSLVGLLSESIQYVRAIRDRAVKEVLNIDASVAIGEIAKLAMANWQDFLMPVEMHDGTVRMYGKPINELTREQAGCVMSFGMVTLRPFEPDSDFKNADAIAGDKPIVVYSYTLFDRSENVEKLARAFKLFDAKRGGDDEPAVKGLNLRGVPSPELEKFLSGLDSLIARSRGDVVDGELA